MADHVQPWNRGREILRLGVRDIEATRELKLDLEILGGVRRDDPAYTILYEHARGLGDELACLRGLRDSFREAAQRDIDERERIRRLGEWKEA